MTEKWIHIAIIGPGIMPIPPTGWGAVEILIWDYAKAIERLGHKVTIINDKNLSNVIETVKSIRPDVAHIQYDDNAYLAEHISPYTKIVGITSHFGYLEQPERWGGYANTFNSIIKQTQSNTYHFTLSEGISNIYKRMGVPEEKIIVAPNGADNIVFQYTYQPNHFDRSIYLAKIDYRKRQHIFQNIDSLYFAGNIADHRFNAGSPRYLGEWSKSYLYENLTHYGNLVLLSDGEADPLVVKEALMCGLGVVVSQWSTAGLDLSKPYITVIPENKIHDLDFVESEIKRNREICAEYRNEIREYGLTFSWSRLAEKYIDNVNGLLKPLNMVVVTSVYKDSYHDILEYCRKYKLHLIVYNKNDELKLGEEYTKIVDKGLTIIDIPNFGRCDYSFLYYIITHYDNLPNKILFTKANYMYENINLEFAVKLDAQFILIGREIKYGIFSKLYDINKLLLKGINNNHIELLNSDKDTTNDHNFQSYLTLDFYRMVYGDNEPPRDEVLNFGYGPCFIVSKQLIRGHSVDIYKKLLDTFYPNKGHWTKWDGHSDEETYIHIGKRYHNNLLRLWSVLFIQDYSVKNISTDYENYVAINM